MHVEAEALTVHRGGAAVLGPVDAALGSGELVGILGPNGAGKSTLLKALAGLLPPGRGPGGTMVSGTVRHGGRPLAAIPAAERARSVAFLEQGAAIEWPMRVRDIVALGRLPHRGAFGGDAAADAAAIDRAMATTGVTRFADRPADTLSGGERMRVLLARALAVEAPVLLADEPIAALDPAHQIDVLDLLRARAGAGSAVAIVLHDLALAARYCDRVILLDRGEKRADAPPAAVLTDENLARVFGIEAIRGTHAGRPFVLPWRRKSGRDEG